MLPYAMLFFYLWLCALPFLKSITETHEQPPNVFCRTAAVWNRESKDRFSNIEKI